MLVNEHSVRGRGVSVDILLTLRNSDVYNGKIFII